MNFDKDIDEVVGLINDNLDPNYTRELLLWKHLENPFGKSIAMVAVYREKIVGVVFYMRYNFENNSGQIIRTIRPLDVCTASSQRGKGIFKILLQKCVEIAKDYNLLFSTPNKKSYPEFIKLGWKTLNDEYYFKIGLISPISLNKHLKLSDFQFDTNLIRNYCFPVNTGKLEFIRWRYSDKVYRIKQFVFDGHVNIIIYRIGKLKGFKSIILCDYIGDESKIEDALKSISKMENTLVIYFLSNYLIKDINFLFIKKHQKAIIIYRENNYSLNQDISISLGDLEAKL